MDSLMESRCVRITPTSSPNTRSKFGSGWLDILTHAICLVMPMILLTAALIAYVFIYQIKPNVQGSSLLIQNSTTPNDHAFYVAADSTMLIFLASWMSSLAPLLTGSAIALTTYPVARQLLQDTDSHNRTSRNPTPFEFHIILKIVSGSNWGGLWDWLRYIFSWKQDSSRPSSALRTLIVVMASAIMLSVLVLGADTWLHVATTTVSLTQIAPLATSNARYSFELIPECRATNNSLAALQDMGLSCTLNGTAQLPVFINPAPCIETINNQSTVASVHLMPNSILSYLSPVSENVDLSYDFVASTYGASVQCRPISRACDLANNGNITFDCYGGPFYAEGSEMDNQSLLTQVFRTSNLSDSEDQNHFYGIENPFYIAGATAEALPLDSPLRKDPEVVAPRYAGAAVFLCDITIIDVKYASRAGRRHMIDSAISNSSVANMFASGMATTSFGYDNIRAAMNMASLTATDAQEFADRFANVLSTAVLSSGAGSVQQSPVSAAQQREQTLVARVPMAPFFFLASINICYIFLGVTLAILATATSYEARQVQYRLTTAGVVACLLEREHSRNDASAIEELYGEYHRSDMALRVGVDRTSKGGFTFGAIPLYTDDGSAQSNATETSGSPQRMRMSRPSFKVLRLNRSPLESQHGDTSQVSSLHEGYIC